MTTQFGIELRKLRIERHENLVKMADKLGISVSHLSSIENGIRSIPKDLVEKVAVAYSLTERQTQDLKCFAENSAKSVKLDLSSLNPTQVGVVTTLSRKLDSMTQEEWERIIDAFKGIEDEN